MELWYKWPFRQDVLEALTWLLSNCELALRSILSLAIKKAPHFWGALLIYFVLGIKIADNAPWYGTSSAYCYVFWVFSESVNSSGFTADFVILPFLPSNKSVYRDFYQNRLFSAFQKSRKFGKSRFRTLWKLVISGKKRTKRDSNGLKRNRILKT